MCVRVSQVTVCMWPSKKNLQVLTHSFHCVEPRIEFRSSGVAANTLTCCVPHWPLEDSKVVLE